MKPIRFPEANTILKPPPGMTEEECEDLPIYRDAEACISCWRMTWLERFQALLTGRIWLSVWSPGMGTQPPVDLDVSSPFARRAEQ